jgi:hypothetical protein
MRVMGATVEDEWEMEGNEVTLNMENFVAMNPGVADDNAITLLVEDGGERLVVKPEEGEEGEEELYFTRSE